MLYFRIKGCDKSCIAARLDVVGEPSAARNTGNYNRGGAACLI